MYSLSSAFYGSCSRVWSFETLSFCIDHRKAVCALCLHHGISKLCVKVVPLNVWLVLWTVAYLYLLTFVTQSPVRYAVTAGRLISSLHLSISGCETCLFSLSQVAVSFWSSEEPCLLQQVSTKVRGRQPLKVSMSTCGNYFCPCLPFRALHPMRVQAFRQNHYGSGHPLYNLTEHWIRHALADVNSVGVRCNTQQLGLYVWYNIIRKDFL